MAIWKEIKTSINNNLSKPLNVQARELSFAGSYVFESSKTFTPDKSGWYKVIVVGAGGNHDLYMPQNTYYVRTGGSGGVCISTLKLLSTEKYEITISGNSASFENMTANRGGNASQNSAGSGGTASGGEFNYPGLAGDYVNSQVTRNGKDVGVFIPSLMERNTAMVASGEYGGIVAYSGYGILGHGASSGVAFSGSYNAVTEAQSGCVIIIPLEIIE